MTSSPGRGLPHLAAAVDQPGVYDTGPYVELARLAEHGVLDFVTLDDTFAGPGLDACAVLSRVAPATHRVGLVPTLGDGGPDPFRAGAAVAGLDRVSRGRAGWRVDGPATEEEPLFPAVGHHAAAPDAPWPRAAGAAARSGDGREDDGADAIGPLPPEGGLVRVADVTQASARAVAARWADVVLVRVTNPAEARDVRDRLRASAAASGRAPDSLRVLVSLLIDLGGGEYAAAPGHGGGGPRPSARGPLYRGGPVDLAELITSWHREGAADGFHLTPVEPRRDLERLVNGTVALLQHRGLFRTFYPGGTLREHLGLTRPAHQTAGGPP
ncbi:LLM class flavin-dependent oxidoreductase [Streptomyces sp. NPDC017936]|uniref:LLM class flavin-dependent oxidoreductase n=1 Tax=Streptomyces sp. NPDC017936 TaxID=3365016 RepID=UPI0037B5B9EB